ncbi:hypothetical protein Ancab_016661 [Ancistrocladus abbreviatus]
MENSELENAPSWENSSRTGNIGTAEGKTSTEQVNAPILQMKLDDSSRFGNISVTNHKNLFSSASDASTSVDDAVLNGPLIREQSFGVFAETEEHPPESNLTAKGNCPAAVDVRMRKKMRYDMPPKSATLIDRMNRILARHVGNSLRSMKPLWSSQRETEILDAKRKILDAPISKNDGELYAPIFRNVSRFLRAASIASTLKGYEVNSLRVIEAIFYECVPVIISDNFVPPFFEVLNWKAFSGIVAEKDIPNLKDILLSIPEEKYLALQLAVRKVQQHFLWHAKPIKYDLFYMTLHSIWFTLPLHGLRVVRKIAFVSWRYVVCYAKSAKVRANRSGEHSLPDSLVYLLIPGLLSNHGPLYFVSTKRFLSKMGLACHIAIIHSEANVGPRLNSHHLASVEHNAWELEHYIEELYWGSGKRLMLLGHSKGGVDAAAALSLYWGDLKDKVAGLALVQSPYGGTPIASDVLCEGQIADKEIRRIMELLICKLIMGDLRSVEDLTYEKSREFILKHKLPEQIPLISFHSEASIAPNVLATMTQVAHAELPQYGEKSDGLVTCRDAEVPGSVVVRPDRKLDHGWMVYSTWNKNSADPDASEMCGAISTLLVELRKAK